MNKTKREILKIGIFDSGMGGISMLNEMNLLFRGAHFYYYGDIANSPYGKKSKEEIVNLTKIACDFFLEKKVKAILLACNTATSASVKLLREIYPIKIFGMEPAIKPAIKENPGEKIAILATQFTISEEKFLELGKSLNASDHLIPFPCEGLAAMIDRRDFDGVKKFLKPILFEIEKDATAIVLGCTHYVLIKDIFTELAPKLKIYDGNKGTAFHILNSMEKTADEKKENTIEVYLNGGAEKDYEILKFFLNC